MVPGQPAWISLEALSNMSYWNHVKSFCRWKWSELTDTSVVILAWRVRKWCLFFLHISQLLMMSLALNKPERERGSLMELYNLSIVWTDGSLWGRVILVSLLLFTGFFSSCYSSSSYNALLNHLLCHFSLCLIFLLLDQFSFYCQGLFFVTGLSFFRMRVQK